MKIEWIEIVAGEFLMGLSQQQLISLQAELPHGREFHEIVDLEGETVQRIVFLETFWIARTPITYGQMNEFVATGHPYADVGGLRKLSSFVDFPLDHPEDVLWHTGAAFCAWIDGRLPTAAEWEKAARGTDGRLYPWGNEWDMSRGNFGQKDRRGRKEGRRTSPVGAYPEGASPYGVCDVIGNIREWTSTFEYDPIKRVEVPVVKGTCAREEIGPDWFVHRVTRHRKGFLIPELAPPYTGFRPVLDKWQHQHWQGFRVGEEGDK